MLFATFQGKFVEDKLKTDGVYRQEDYYTFTNGNGVDARSIEEYVGYKPIFAFPMKDKAEFLVRCNMCFPSFPQRMIIFKSNKYQRVGYLGWFKTLFKSSLEVYGELDVDTNDSYTEYLEFNNNKLFNEYIVPKIELKDVKKIINISDLDNVISDLGRTPSNDYCDFIDSKRCADLLDKYIKVGNSVSFVPPIDVSETVCNQITLHLKNIVQKSLQVDEKYVRDTYNLIRTNCIRYR